MLLLCCLDISDLHLFYLLVLSNPVFNCSGSLSSSSVDKATTGTYNFVSAISNVAFVGLLTATTSGLASGSASLVALLVITQFSNQVKIKDTSQSINGISSVF